MNFIFARWIAVCLFILFASFIFFGVSLRSWRYGAREIKFWRALTIPPATQATLESTSELRTAEKRTKWLLI